jgi:hypothetical protein
MNATSRGIALVFPSWLRKPHLDLMGALLFALAYFWLWPTRVLPDDAGIILKYMDNFADGHFYTYNVADGPVFGISSFLHGIVAGFFAYTKLFSATGSVLASNFIGLILAAFFLLRILDHYISDLRVLVIVWLVILLTATNWMKSVVSGMETPLHVAVILFCFYCVLQNYQRLTWAAFALALLTKLDSAPIVAVLGLVFLWQNRTDLRSPRGWLQLSKNALLFGGAPLAIWLVFSYAVFGGPLPQSAYAKLYYHAHPTDHWFPYLEMLINHRVGQGFMLLFLGLWIGYALYALSGRGEQPLLVLMYGLACFGYFALFYYYNPVERHPWYYAIPEILMRLQIVIIGILLLQRYWPRRAALATLLGCLALLAAGGIHTLLEARMHVHVLELIETERMEIGMWIREQSEPDDVLLAAHGHIAYQSGLHTIDFSGLNSPIVTTYARNLELIVRDLRPDWIAMQEIDAPWMRELGYVPQRSFYNITTIGFPAWRIYRRVADAPPTRLAAVSADAVQTDESVEPFLLVPVNVLGSEITVAGVPDGVRSRAFTAGVMHKPVPMRIEARVKDADGALLDEKRWEVPAARQTDIPGQPTSELWIELDPAWRVAAVEFTGKAIEDDEPLSIWVTSPTFVVEE